MKPNDHEGELKHEAEAARARLLETVDELDARKHQLETKASAARFVPYVIGAVVGLFVLTTIVDGMRAWSRRHRRRRLLRRFFRACG